MVEFVASISSGRPIENAFQVVCTSVSTTPINKVVEGLPKFFEGPDVAHLISSQSHVKIEVLEYEPFRRYSIAYTCRGCRVEETYTFEAVIDSTRISYRARSAARGPILRWVLKNYLQDRFAQLKALLAAFPNK